MSGQINYERGFMYTRRPRNDISSDHHTKQVVESSRHTIANTPIHRRALGLYATLSVESQNMLSSHAHAIGQEICDADRIDYDEMLRSGQYNIREGHRITVAPLTQIGSAMHTSARGCQTTNPFVGSRHRANFNRLKPEVIRRLNGYSDLRGKARIVGFDWFGTNGNVLVALIDESTDIYKKMLGAQNSVRRSLATVGIDDCDLYPPNHITILRMGTKKNPYVLSDEAKTIATDMSLAKLGNRKKHVITDGISSIGSVAINGLTIIEADNSQEDLEPVRLRTTVLFEI